MTNTQNLSQHPLYEKDISAILKFDFAWQKLKDATILITGASGLVGKTFVDALLLLDKKFNLNITLVLVSRNLSVENFGSNNKNIKCVRHDVTQPFTEDVFQNTKFDFIIHMASNTHPVLYSTEPVSTITTNIYGTHNLLELARKNSGCRFLLLSSVEIYGAEISGETKKWKERDCAYIDCNTMRAGYPEAKRVSESLCCAYAKEYDVDFVTARLCRCYGHALLKTDSKALSQFIFKAVNTEDIILKSEGTQLFSYIYVVDAVSALLCILLNGKTGDAYNIADEKSDARLRDLAEICANAVGKKVIFDLPDEAEKKGFSNAQIALLDSEKLQNIGWSACFDIKTGIEHTVEILRGENK